MTNKEKFLTEHNKLSPLALQATMRLLSRFEIDKPSLCRKGNWSIEKARRPFIMWLTSLKAKEIKIINEGGSQKYEKFTQSKQKQK
jgi:hypothetical protein